MTVALDCLVGDWTDWSERSEDGKIRRTRNVMRNAINGGAMCPNLEQTQLGNLYVLVFFNVYLIIIASPVISNLKKKIIDCIIYVFITITGLMPLLMDY